MCSAVLAKDYGIIVGHKVQKLIKQIYLKIKNDIFTQWQRRNYFPGGSDNDSSEIQQTIEGLSHSENWRAFCPRTTRRTLPPEISTLLPAAVVFPLLIDKSQVLNDFFFKMATASTCGFACS